MGSFNLPLSKSINVHFDPQDQDITLRFTSWGTPRQLSLTRDETLALVELISQNAETIKRDIEKSR